MKSWHLILRRRTIAEVKSSVLHWGLYFEPRDLWLGAYWNIEWNRYEVYLCMLPLLPFKITWWR